MDNKTEITLRTADTATKRLSFYNDTSLSLEDIDLIRQKISECTNLESLAITGCNLDTLSRNMIEAIATHPNLRSLDFSENKIWDLAAITEIIQRNKRIYELNIAYGESGNYRNASFQKFLEQLKSGDSLVKLKISDTPYREDGLKWSDYEVRSIFDEKHVRNLCSIEFTSDPGYSVGVVAGASTKAANKAAEELYSALKKGQIKDRIQATELETRLPALFYLADMENRRGELIKDLEKLNKYLFATFGMSVGYELYLTANDRAPAVPVAVETRADLPSIAEVASTLPVFAEKLVREQLAVGRNNPVSLMELGKDQVGCLSSISLASLQAATSVPGLEAPVRSMGDFLAAFSEAKEIVRKIAAQPQQSRTEPSPTAPSGVPSFIKTLMFWTSSTKGKADNMYSLADAGEKAREAGKILQELIPALSGMEERITDQLSSTQKVIAAYETIGAQVAAISVIGNDVLSEWRSEAQAVTAPVAYEPFHVQSLATRLEFLGQVGTQVGGHAAQHMLHAAVEQKQLIGMATLRGQNIPLIAEQVATFIRQLEELQRAGVINSLADATREATNTERETTALAAIRTVEAIENLAESTQEALHNMGKTAQEITAGLTGGAQTKPMPLLPGSSVPASYRHPGNRP